MYRFLLIGKFSFLGNNKSNSCPEVRNTVVTVISVLSFTHFQEKQEKGWRGKCDNFFIWKAEVSHREFSEVTGKK